MNFTSILALAALLEAVVNALKPIYSEKARQETNLVTFYSALVGGVLLGVLSGVDIFAPAGVPLDTFPILEPWAGYVFTGVILSRPANVLADMIQLLRDFVNNSQVTLT